MRLFLDASVLIAAFLGDDPRHERAKKALLQFGPKRTFTSAHAMAECYAALTTLPIRPRIHPLQAERYLDDVGRRSFLVELTQQEYLRVIGEVAERGHTGGMIYDALHMESARKAKAQRVLTFNTRHFQSLAPEWADRIAEP